MHRAPTTTAIRASLAGKGIALAYKALQQTGSPYERVVARRALGVASASLGANTLILNGEPLQLGGQNLSLGT